MPARPALDRSTRASSATETLLLVAGVAIAVLVAITLFGRRVAGVSQAGTRELDGAPSTGGPRTDAGAPAQPDLGGGAAADPGAGPRPDPARAGGAGRSGPGGGSALTNAIDGSGATAPTGRPAPPANAEAPPSNRPATPDSLLGALEGQGGEGAEAGPARSPGLLAAAPADPPGPVPEVAAPSALPGQLWPVGSPAAFPAPTRAPENPSAPPEAWDQVRSADSATRIRGLNAITRQANLVGTADGPDGTRLLVYSDGRGNELRLLERAGPNPQPVRFDVVRRDPNDATRIVDHRGTMFDGSGSIHRTALPATNGAQRFRIVETDRAGRQTVSESEVGSLADARAVEGRFPPDDAVTAFLSGATGPFSYEVRTIEGSGERLTLLRDARGRTLAIRERPAEGFARRDVQDASGRLLRTWQEDRQREGDAVVTRRVALDHVANRGSAIVRRETPSQDHGLIPQLIPENDGERPWDGQIYNRMRLTQRNATTQETRSVVENHYQIQDGRFQHVARTVTTQSRGTGPGGARFEHSVRRQYAVENGVFRALGASVEARHEGADGRPVWQARRTIDGEGRFLWDSYRGADGTGHAELVQRSNPARSGRLGSELNRRITAHAVEVRRLHAAGDFAGLRRMDKNWVERDWEVIESAPEYAALSPAAQASLRAVWRGIARFQNELTQAGEPSGTARMAAINLADRLAAGAFADERGAQALASLERRLAADREAKGFPDTSDILLLLYDRTRFEGFVARGGAEPPQRTAAEMLPEALEVAQATRSALWSGNRGSGIALEAGQRVGAAAWDVLSLGVTRITSWARDEQAITNQGGIGLAQTRDRANAEGVGEIMPGATPDDRRNALLGIQRMAEITNEEGWGNCMECAAVVASELHRRGFRGVEVMHRLGGDQSSNSGNHAFVVVGRDPNSDPGDPSTWGPNAIIVDGWDAGGRAYRASEWNVQETGITTTADLSRDRLAGRGPIQSHFRLPDP